MRPASQQEQADKDESARAARAHTADKSIIKVYEGLRANSLGASPSITRLKTNSVIKHEGRRLGVLFDTAIDCASGEPVAFPEKIRPDSYRAIKISFRWHGILTTLSFELHTEFLTLTAVLDASPLKSASEIEILRRDEVFDELFLTLSALARVKSATPSACSRLYRHAYHLIWERFGVEIFEPMRGMPSVRHQFLDFRGLILGTNRNHSDFDFSPPWSRDSSDGGTGLERDPICKIDEFESLWSFLTCALPKDTEFTLSRFLENRAFYATALGNQSDILNPAKAGPLFYLFYEDTINPWQLGRMIYRVHRAGTARIAAIMHFDHLMVANRILAEVEAQIDLANSIMCDQETSSVGFDDELRPNMHRLYGDVEAALTRLPSPHLDGTLDYRIERSRYYVNQFARITNSLRIKRVSGFQQYDEFVDQRLGPVFEYIDSLGRRYGRMQSERTLLLSRLQTMDALHEQRLISEAQRIADIALSCALGPYYVGYMIAYSVEDPEFRRLVWITALTFGMIMYLLITVVKSQPLEAMFGERVGRFLSRRATRFVAAFVLASLVTWAWSTLLA